MKVFHDRFQEFIDGNTQEKTEELLAQFNKITENAIEIFKELKMENEIKQCHKIQESLSKNENKA